MTNQERRQLLMRFRQSGMEGSILDVFQAAQQGRDLIGEFQQQQERQQPIIATTPEEQREGLRPYHAAGETDRSMVFKDVPPNTPFNTMGMKRPINIEKRDPETGHLIESHKSVPPGIRNIPTGPYTGDVIETPADGYRDGGFVFKRSMQSGGFTEEGGEIDESLDAVTTEHYLAKTRGQTPEFWRATADTLAFHESGPHQRMDPQAVQVGGGPGRGLLQFEPEALITAQKRHAVVARAMGLQPDPEIMAATSADQLSQDQQYTLFYSDMIENPNLRLKDYASGKMPIADLWLKGHKKKEAEGDRESFEESREAAKTGLKEFGLKMGGARQRWSKKQKGGPRDDENELAVQGLIRKQQEYLDALAASGIPFTGDESFDKDFVGYTKTQGSAEGLDKRYADLDRLHNDFYEEAKRLKELGLVRQIRAQKNYYAAPAYSDGLGGTIQQQHGTRYDVYDIVLPPKRKPPPPAPEKLKKKGVEPIERESFEGLKLPPGPPPPVELPEVTIEGELGEVKDRRKSKRPRRNRMYRTTRKGNLVARKRKFRKQGK